MVFLYNVGFKLIIFNKNKMSKLDEKKLVLIKFQPEEILFMHRDSRVIYRYFDLTQDVQEYPKIEHQMLQRGILFNKGVLYQKEQSSLKQEISERNRSFNKNYFNEEEIVNTFHPLLEAIQFIHQQGFTHGSIKLQNIVIIDSQLKLKDWLSETASNNKKEDDDWAAIGQCMLCCTFLTAEKMVRSEGEKLIVNLAQKMSKNFIITLLIFLRQIKPYYKHTISILSGQSHHIDQHLNALYQQLKQAKTKKENQNKEVITFSPAKKITITQKKATLHQNIENKIQKAKHNEKNSSIYELMSKKLNDQEKKLKEQNPKKAKDKAPIINLSNFGVQNNSKKMQAKEIRWSPKKLRNFSKKK